MRQVLVRKVRVAASKWQGDRDEGGQGERAGSRDAARARYITNNTGTERTPLTITRPHVVVVVVVFMSYCHYLEHRR